MPAAREVVRLLETAFAYVRADADEGLRAARRTAERLERASPVAFFGRRAEVLEHAKKLRSLELGEALAIEFGDHSERTLRFTLLPGDRIVFGYRGSEDEEQARDLVRRCADALDCEIEVI